MERTALYNLKRQYGGRIQIYKLLGATTNVETGDKEIDKDVYDVRRAIILPTKVFRENIQSISIISANKKFVQGGRWDAGTKTFIVERRDVPGISELTMDDWIVYASRRFQITDVWEYEFDSGWIINAKMVGGITPKRILNLRGEDNVTFSQEGTTDVS